MLIGIIVAVSVTSASASKLGDLRSAEDKAKLHEILLSVGVTDARIAEVRASMSEADAKDLMWRAHSLSGDEQRYAEALELLKDLLAYDPDRQWTWPEKKAVASPLDELAWVLFRMNDWARALPVCELCDSDGRILHPNGDLSTPNQIDKCREELAKMGKLSRSPLIVVAGAPVTCRTIVVGTLVLISASEIASMLDLRVSYAGTGKVTLTAGSGKPKTLRITVGKTTALADGKDLELRGAPEQSDREILVPLRPIAEYFGAKVEWDPGRKL